MPPQQSALPPLPPIGAEVPPELLLPPLPPIGSEVGAETGADFRTTNEKDAQGNAIVRGSTLWEWLRGKQEDMPPDVAAEFRAAQDRMAGRAPAIGGDVLAENAADLALGPLKGAANTVVGLGAAAYNYLPGVSRLSDAAQRAMFGNVQPAVPEQNLAGLVTGAPPAPGLFAGARQAVQPTSPLQSAGFAAEQLGEFFVPATKAGRLLRPGAAVQAGLTTLAQTGSPTAAGVSAVLGGALPGTGSLPGSARAAASLERSAEKTVVGALGPTKEWAKETAMEVAPEILARGVKGSRAEMLAQASREAKEVGRKIGAAVQAAAAQGTTVSGPDVIQALLTARDGLLVRTARGKKIPISGTEPVVAQLDRLIRFTQQLGKKIPFDKAAHIKTTWDNIVSKAGLYGPKATASATDSATAWSVREAASAFRALLAKGSPEVDALNQEYKFWIGLRKVLKETQRRTQSHGGGLISGSTGGVGVVAGLATGETAQDKAEKALLYGVAGRQLIRVLQSPAWATRVSAPLKQALADALASGNQTRIAGTIQRILASVPAQFRSAPTPESKE